MISDDYGARAAYSSTFIRPSPDLILMFECLSLLDIISALRDYLFLVTSSYIANFLNMIAIDCFLWDDNCGHKKSDGLIYVGFDQKMTQLDFSDLLLTLE